MTQPVLQPSSSPPPQELSLGEVSFRGRLYQVILCYTNSEESPLTPTPEMYQTIQATTTLYRDQVQRLLDQVTTDMVPERIDDQGMLHGTKAIRHIWTSLSDHLLCLGVPLWSQNIKQDMARSVIERESSHTLGRLTREEIAFLRALKMNSLAQGVHSSQEAFELRNVIRD